MQQYLAVLIPTYNAAQFIAEALNSLLNSTTTAANVAALYIADDNSTDNTVSLARATWTGNIPLHIIQLPANVGETRNVNNAMRTVEEDGFDWVLLLHQDDLLDSRWIELATASTRTAGSDVALICCSNTYQDVSAGKDTVSDLQNTRKRPNIHIHVGGEESLRALRDRWFWNASGTVFRVCDFNGIGGFHPHLCYAGDNDFLCRVFLSGKSVIEHTNPHVLKRHHEGSQTSRASRTGADAVGWCHLMHRYLPYSSKTERARDYFRMIYGIGRRIPVYVRRRRWLLTLIQCRSVLILAQSFVALLLGVDDLIPRKVRRLLEYDFADARTRCLGDAVPLSRDIATTGWGTGE